jgi:hypothetical protein
MPRPTPLYTRDNCSFASPLQWGLSVFWREPETDSDWFHDLAAATEPDGIRLLGHRFEKPGIGQFGISTVPCVPRLVLVQPARGARASGA